MEQLFIPYEIAKLLKQKGFEWNCFGYWIKSKNSNKAQLTIGDNFNEEEIDAPLYQQVVDWFREKHSFWIQITWYWKDYKNSDEILWSASIENIGNKGEFFPYENKDEIFRSLMGFNSPNEAYNKVFEYCLNNLV